LQFKSWSEARIHGFSQFMMRQHLFINQEKQPSGCFLKYKTQNLYAKGINAKLSTRYGGEVAKEGVPPDPIRFAMMQSLSDNAL
jgi:hypothetical protein